MFIKITKPAIAFCVGIVLPFIVLLIIKESGFLTAMIATATLFSIAGFLYGKVNVRGIFLLGIFLYAPLLIMVIMVVLTSSKMMSYIFPLSCILAISGTYAGLFIRAKWSESSVPKNTGRLLIWVSTYLVAAFILVPIAKDRESFRRVNDNAPEFRLQLINGEVVESSELEGKILILEFWTTWCPACNGQFPELQKLYDRYKDNPEVSFIAVNTSWGKDTIDKTRSFAIEHFCSFPVAFDSAGVVTKRMGVLGDRGIPQTLLVDKNWTIRIRHVGFDKDGDFASSMSSQIDKLLNES